MDSHGSPGEEVRFELESLRRDVGYLMQEMRNVRTAPSKPRGFTAESPGNGDLGSATSRRTREDHSQQAPSIATEVQESSTAALQPQFSDFYLGEYPPGNLSQWECFYSSCRKDVYRILTKSLTRSLSMNW